jgi:hypothetical protein
VQNSCAPNPRSARLECVVVLHAIGSGGRSPDGDVRGTRERDLLTNPHTPMHHTRASVLAAEPEATRADRMRHLAGHSAVFLLEVENLDAIECALAGMPIVKARHETFSLLPSCTHASPAARRLGSRCACQPSRRRMLPREPRPGS